ncbi:hypothetical protein [Streptomyces sp. NPDC047315]|uniref:hypothetical protein n=1 Tax=Streptomyces sp. NPDC047315 TaxID=3155142 RepID=UPI0033CD7F11
MPTSLATAGRITSAAVSTALALPLLTGTAAAVERRPADRDAAALLASKPEGPIESSLSVGATGVLGAVGARYIIRRHRHRNRRR